MKAKINTFLNLLGVLALLLSGCSTQNTEQPAAPTQASVLQQPVIQADATPTAPPTATIFVASEATPTQIAIAHQTMPENPAYTQALPEECNTGFNYEIGFRVGRPCDNWGINLLERPVSADMSNYYHYIDILGAQIGKSNEWFYASLNLFGAGIVEDGVPLTYFFELDVDQNGRGDILLAVQNLDLYSSAWSVTGVRAWRDLNGDVGGSILVRPDDHSGDGYETLIFDEGLGGDPDLVWARHNPDNYQQIEFAFKSTLLDGNESFMWWAGAMRGNFDPQAYDLVDNQSETEFYEVDTTCGWIFGYEKGYNLKKCYLPAKPTEAAPQSVCIKPPHPNPQDNGWVWNEAKCKWELWN
jgi:hypothetical protein